MRVVTLKGAVVSIGRAGLLGKRGSVVLLFRRARLDWLAFHHGRPRRLARKGCGKKRQAGQHTQLPFHMKPSFVETDSIATANPFVLDKASARVIIGAGWVANRRQQTNNSRREFHEDENHCAGRPGCRHADRDVGQRPATGAARKCGGAGNAEKTTRTGKHVNRVIDMWLKNQPVYYAQISGGGYEEGKKMAATKADYITYEMEHGPLDFKELREFMRGLVEAGPTRTGHKTPAVDRHVAHFRHHRRRCAPMPG